MEAFLIHVFNFAESYTVILLWTVTPLLGIYLYFRFLKRLQSEEEGKDAENRPAA